MNKKLTRKMLTAAGGPLRIKFTPEQIAEFERQLTRVPGMNNSGMSTYRTQGVQALLHLKQEALRKEEEIKSRMEMRPTLKRKAEKLGDKDEYEYTPLVVGMSGADPVGEFILAGVGLNGIGALAKTGLWETSRFLPKTWVGNYGRLYFVGNAFKNSFNEAIPILTPLLTSKNLFRTKVYKGGEIEDPYSNFLTTDPKYAANYGKVSPYIFESKSVAKAKEPMMGSSDPVTMDMFVYNNIKENPNATAIIGHDAVTGEFTPSKGIEIYSMSPTNLFKINNSEKGRIFTGFRELQGLLDVMNNSHSAPHPPIYERVSYSKYSADAANPKERDLVILHFKSRYPNSGLQLTSPLKISGFTYDNLLKVGELPLSEEGKAIADVMARRMKNYKLREGLDPNIVHFGQNRFSRSGIDGMMNQIKNDKTIAYMPLKNSDNYGGLYEGGEAFLKLNPWRKKPYIYSLIHEGVSHMTDDFVKDLRTPVSGKKLLSDLSRNFDGTKASDSMYGRISYPNDIYDEKLIEKILHKDSMKAIESRSTNWEMITNLYRILAKEKGISYKLATELPDSEFEAFIEKTLDSPEKLSKFMEKFDNLYLLDYSNLMKAGTKELANQFYKRIKGMLKYGPSLITGGYFLTSQNRGGKMNIIEQFKQGSRIHIKKKNRGKFTSYCGGKVTDECILKGKNSSNPAIRKRATFADNARHFKHRLGGSIVEAFKLYSEGFKKGGTIKTANARKWKHKTGGSFKGYPSKAAYEVRLEEVAGFKKGGIVKALLGSPIFINLPLTLSSLWNKSKNRMYRTITPKGYNIGLAITEFAKGNNRDFSKFTPVENEVWAKYLNVPYEGESNFEPAIYKPTKGGGSTYKDVVKLKDESKILSDDVINKLLENYKKTGKTTMLIEGNESGLGTYTVSLGLDKDGKKYASYYDDWDINPTRGLSAKYHIPLLELIGDVVPGSHPFSIYGRRYYKKGGIVKAQEGNKVNWGLFAMNAGNNLLQMYSLNKQLNNLVDSIKALNEINWANTLKQIIKENILKRNLFYLLWVQDYSSGVTSDNPSLIVAQHFGYEDLNNQIAEGEQELKNKNSQIAAQLNLAKSNNLINGIGEIFQQGINMYGNYLANKQSTSTPKSSTVGTNTVLTNIGNNKLLSNNYDSMKFLGL